MRQYKIDDLRRVREIQAPETLKQRTLAAIGQEAANRSPRTSRHAGRYLTAAAAVAAASFVLAVNTSPAFAANLADVPGLGALARIVSVRSDAYQTADSTVTIDEPAVTGMGSDRVNALIHAQVEAYEAQAAADLAAYKEAFLATGGTEDEFAAKNIQVSVDYAVKSQTGEVLSFVVSGTEDWNAGKTVRQYYNLRLSDGSEITLEDVLGADWVAEANGQIVTQIEAHNRAAAADSSLTPYFTPEIDPNGFRTVDTQTDFYLNADGAPVVVFPKYAVGPGSLGEPEFVLHP